MSIIARLARPFLAAAALAALSFSIAGPAAAQVQAGQAFGDWTTNCQPIPDGELCFIEQVVSNEASNIFTEVAVAPGAEGGPQLLIRVPLGVLLAEGLGLQIDENEPVGIPYQICTPQGCQILVPLTDDGINRMKAGSTLQVMFVVPGGEVASAPISLSGFTAGFDALAP